MSTPTSPLQKHATAIGASLLTAVIVFLGQSFFADRVNKAEGAVLIQKVEQLTVQVIELSADIKSMRNSYVNRDDFRDHETRIRRLEGLGK